MRAPLLAREKWGFWLPLVKRSLARNLKRSAMPQLSSSTPIIHQASRNFSNFDLLLRLSGNNFIALYFRNSSIRKPVARCLASFAKPGDFPLLIQHRLSPPPLALAPTPLPYIPHESRLPVCHSEGAAEESASPRPHRVPPGAPPTPAPLPPVTVPPSPLPLPYFTHESPRSKTKTPLLKNFQRHSQKVPPTPGPKVRGRFHRHQVVKDQN